MLTRTGISTVVRTHMSLDAIRLWQLISPTLPVGAYSYSQALEWVIESGEVRGEAGALAWIGGLLEHSVARLDLPVLLRVYGAWSQRDADAVRRWSRELVARRETAELRLEDLAMGGALARLVASLEAESPRSKSPADELPTLEWPFASAFAVASVNWSIDARAACAGYAWAWCEAQVSAAVKLVPLGHTAGQRILRALGAVIPTAVDVALACSDDAIGLGLPGFAIGSARHETQYTRLFRS
jgi:urease accessory protein